MKLPVDAWTVNLGKRVPRAVLLASVRASVRDLHVSLCLHRVLEVRRASDPQPALTIAPGELDELIGMFIEVRPENPRLTVTFDDGYADAAQYVADRAPRFPTVEFLVFVC